MNTITAFSTVAEKIAIIVMGWSKIRVCYEGTGAETVEQQKFKSWLDFVGIDAVGAYYVDFKTDFWMRRDDWHPEENIAQAWQVLERVNAMRNEVLFLDFCNHFYDDDPTHCCWLLERSASAAAKAICDAALKAYQVA